MNVEEAIDVDERIWEVLDALQGGDAVTADTLSARLGVTPRTVRTIIARSRAHLGEAGAEILSSPGVGYQLRLLDPEGFDAALAARRHEGIPQTSRERVRYLLELLLTAPDYIKIDDIAQDLFVSRATLTADLHRVEEKLEEHSLLLDRKPYRGIKVVGAEVDVRHCLAATFGDVTALVDPGDVELETVVSAVLAEHEVTLSERALSNLAIHLAVALKRLEAGNVVTADCADLPSVVTEREAALAAAILDAVGDVAGVRFGEGERWYLALNLAGKRLIGSEFRDDALRAEAQGLVREIVDILDASYGFSMGRDHDLMASLTQHVIPLLIRLRYRIHLTNPMLDQIKEAQPLAFVMASHAAAVIARHVDGPVSADEVGYIAMWFALSLEKRRPKPRPKNLVLVSTSGEGSARMLEWTFRERFGDLVGRVLTAEAHRFDAVDLTGVDAVFTTVPLTPSGDVPVHEVHGFLDEDETRRVRRLLSRERSTDVVSRFSRELFLPSVKGRTRDEVLSRMTEACHRARDLPDVFSASVKRREELASTDFGNLVAMPHAEVAMSPETFVCVGILDEPVRWARHDVQVVFLASISNREGEDLRRFYGTLSRYLMDPESIGRLIKTRDFDDLVEALTEIEKKVEVS